MEYKAKVIFADSRQLDKILPEKSVDLILSGPPYWNEVVYSDDDAQLSKIDNYSDFLFEISKCWNGCAEVLKNGSILAIWVHDLLRKKDDKYEYIPLHSDIAKTFPKNLVLKNICIWDRYLNKDRGLIESDQISTRVQYILIFQKKGESSNSQNIETALNKIYWNPVWRKKTTPKLLGSGILFRICNIIARPFNLGGLSKEIGILKDDYEFKNYTTECPPDIANHLIKLFSSPGDIVLDPFAGSGTTLKEALMLGRQSIGVDINKKSETAIKNKLGDEVTFI